jgi:hypothetical protein
MFAPTRLLWFSWNDGLWKCTVLRKAKMAERFRTIPYGGSAEEEEACNDKEKQTNPRSDENIAPYLHTDKIWFKIEPIV